MTLIIGCIAPDFGIIAGDTQLSIGDLNRGNFKRRTQLKVFRPSKDFLLGILGRWSFYHPKEDGSADRYDEDELLFRKISSFNVKDKLEYLQKFISARDKIDATAIYVKVDKKNFEIGSVSTSDKNSKDEHPCISNLSFDDVQFKFNECFYKAQSNFVETIIYQIKNDYKLTNSLEDSLFLINNVMLEVICQGRNVDVKHDNGEDGTVTNSVGGYITIQVLNLNQLATPNNLSLTYSSDYNCLLDKLTNPFSKLVDISLSIRYIDNLAMLVKSINSPFQKNIYDSLIIVIKKQIHLIIEKDLIDRNDMNEIIKFINAKYDLKFDLIEVEQQNENQSEVTLEVLLPDENNDLIDLKYLLKFF
ncbi:hypothetical protein [Flavivirga sp. 57AJ16]|uniref:hypothetical protein n=1 Tax=Flavivirga sp. 57AJ16 TaxID=3025307 RepID=UPI002365D9AA|nr:hypothetical protein [Flavivirga sp. 57AJ16]MDD7886136.1 hypothetical protein [Flavivirga sp. 57AJ16]